MGLVEAIENRNLVAFQYEGHPRVVQPCAFGIHVSTGNEVLRGYQIRGTSRTHAVPGWGGLYRLDQMDNVDVLSERFLIDPDGYRRDDRHMSTIFAQL